MRTSSGQLKNVLTVVDKTKYELTIVMFLSVSNTNFIRFLSFPKVSAKNIKKRGMKSLGKKFALRFVSTLTVGMLYFSKKI